MIKTKDAIAVARKLIGTPYSELDCINLIKKVIRTAPGGVPGYTTAGTNTLWDSINASAKYRDLTERHEGLDGIPAGALAFKRYGTDQEDHVGIATGEGTIIHSSSVGGRGVVETPLTASQGRDCWGIHRYIETGNAAEEGEETKMTDSYSAQVVLKDENSSLNVRRTPGGQVIDRLGHGESVQVIRESGEWMLVRYGDGGSGYVSAQYLAAREEAEPEPDKTETTLMSKEGVVIVLKGDWRIAQD